MRQTRLFTYHEKKVRHKRPHRGTANESLYMPTTGGQRLPVRSEWHRSSRHHPQSKRVCLEVRTDNDKKQKASAMEDKRLSLDRTSMSDMAGTSVQDAVIGRYSCLPAYPLGYTEGLIVPSLTPAIGADRHRDDQIYCLRRPTEASRRLFAPFDPHTSSPMVFERVE